MSIFHYEAALSQRKQCKNNTRYVGIPGVIFRLGKLKVDDIICVELQRKKKIMTYMGRSKMAKLGDTSLYNPNEPVFEIYDRVRKYGTRYEFKINSEVITAQQMANDDTVVVLDIVKK